MLPNDCDICDKYLLSKENWLLCCKERHQLLLECFKTLLRCIGYMGVVSDCICLPLVCLTMPFSTEVDSQIAHKILDVEYLHSQYGKWDDSTLGETPTDYEVFQTFLRCISQMGGASDSINLPLVGFTMPFSFTVDCQIAHKM